jgi:hypothetical protein
MNQSNFAAQNELEKKLVNMLDSDMSGEDFLHYLIDAQVYMPIEDEKNAIKGFQRTTKAQPLVIEDDEGTQVLIIFSSPARAKEFTEEFPGFGGGLLTEFSWILRKMDAPISIALNPGFDTGFDLDAAMVADMMANLPPESQ